MREQIIKLREVMAEKGLDAWICPSSDAHQSEYPSEYDKARRYFSGFTGSAGTLLVLQDEAFLWTDGRYFLQAAQELEGSGITLMKMGTAGVETLPQLLSRKLSAGNTVGYNGNLLSWEEGSFLARQLENTGIRFEIGGDLTDTVWKDRPKRSAAKVWLMGEEFAGESYESKAGRVRKEMGDANLCVISSLSDIAWLTNLRGGDIERNPLFLSYFILGKAEGTLFIQREALTREVQAYLDQNRIQVREYDSFDASLLEIKNQRILLDGAAVSYKTALTLSREEGGNTLAFQLNPVTLFKNIKNETEIAHLKACHIRDGVYMAKYIYWVKRAVQQGMVLTEKTASDHLDGLRAADEKFVDLSFNTISGYGENAAVVHYEARRASAKRLEPRGLYLFDSGGQYLDGTTDVTRTISLGPVTKEEREHYTLVTLGMLRLMGAVFKEGAKGVSLDVLAREALWQAGLDYNHGTGHGVGFVNTVHEAPVSIRNQPNSDPQRDVVLKPGMVTSDEPGVYIDGKHGIRMEILVFVKEKQEGFLCFEPLTFAPIERGLMEVSLMNSRDIALYNAYQKQVFERIAPGLTQEERSWLEEETKPF